MSIHFLKTRMNRGGQFENLLTFLKMPPPPPLSQVKNDQPQREMGKREHPQYVLFCLNTIRLIHS